jgi:hypothetical protein
MKIEVYMVHMMETVFEEAQKDNGRNMCFIIM